MNNPTKVSNRQENNPKWEVEWYQLQFLEFRKAALGGLLANPEVFHYEHSNRDWKGNENCSRVVGCAEAHASAMMSKIGKPRRLLNK